MSCYFCQGYREGWTTYFCNDCTEMSRIVKVYGKEEVLDILRTTCIRNKTQIKNKIDIVKKEQEKSVSPPPPPTTRSQKKKELTKM